MKDRNIDFNSQNEDGETPLHYGLRYGGNITNFIAANNHLKRL